MSFNWTESTCVVWAYKQLFLRPQKEHYWTNSIMMSKNNRWQVRNEVVAKFRAGLGHKLNFWHRYTALFKSLFQNIEKMTQTKALFWDLDEIAEIPSSGGKSDSFFKENKTIKTKWTFGRWPSWYHTSPSMRDTFSSSEKEKLGWWVYCSLGKYWKKKNGIVQHSCLFIKNCVVELVENMETWNS